MQGSSKGSNKFSKGSNRIVEANDFPHQAHLRSDDDMLLRDVHAGPLEAGFGRQGRQRSEPADSGSSEA